MLKQLVVLFLSLSLGLGEEHCDTLGVLLYEDIGCEPVKVEGKTCPVAFECPKFKHGNGTCTFKKRLFNSGENVTVELDLTYSSCRAGCTCNPTGNFTCTFLDCPEDWADDLPFGCNRTYTPGTCCSTGQRCSKVEFLDSKPTLIHNPDLAKCTVDGKDYLEGDRFHPSNACANCVCLKGFDGKFVEPFCTRQVCSEQVKVSDSLAKNCAPVYFGDGHRCCPDAYICPKDTDEIQQVSAENRESELMCKFGKMDVKLGESLETDNDQWGPAKEVKCECVLPPFLTCVETK